VPWTSSLDVMVRRLHRTLSQADASCDLCAPLVLFLRTNTPLERRKAGRQEGRKEGRKEGREEGRKEGRNEGRKEGRGRNEVRHRSGTWSFPRTTEADAVGRHVSLEVERDQPGPLGECVE
jgi:hypothetical protein